MENPIKMDDLGGKPTIFGNIHIICLFVFWGFFGALQAVTNRNGHTALHLAAMRGHASACPGYP